MTNLLLEIERIKEIMGIEVIDNLISEQVGLLPKIFGVADNALKDIEENKSLIKQLDNLKPKGVKRLTQMEIDELAELLSKQADEIASAQASIGFEGAKRIASANKLHTLITQTARTQADSLLNLYIDKQLTKIFNNTENFWNKGYVGAVTKTNNDFLDIIDSGLIIPEDEIIASFKSNLETELKKIDPDFKWKDYPEYENWVMKKFNDLDGDLDNITKNHQYLIEKSKNRNSAFGSTSTKTVTKLDDIEAVKLSNFRALNGIYKKLKNFIKKTPAIESFEKNVALLKGYPVNNIFTMVNGTSKMSEDFAALIRNIAFDIEQVANIEKNTLVRWRELMTEVEAIDPKLVENMKEVPIFKEVGNGWIWQEEKLNAFIGRLELRFEGAAKEGGGFFGLIKEEFKEIIGIVTLGKKSIITSTKNIYAGTKGFIKGIANAKFFSAGIWSAPFSPKQIGLMLSRRGYAPLPFLRSFLETWFTVHLWQNVVYTVIGLLADLGTWGLEKMGVDVTDDNRSVIEAMGGTLSGIWLDYTTYLEFPFKPGFLIDFGVWAYDVLYGENMDQTTRELEQDRDTAFDKLWTNMSEEKQEKVLEGLEVGGTDFDTFSKVIDRNGPRGLVWYPKFKAENNLTDEQIQKLKESRVATVSKETKLGLSPDKLKQIIKDFDIDEYLKVGGIKDKNGVVYTIKSIDKNIFKYEFIPPDKFTFYGVQPEETNKKWYIYKDESNKEPQWLSATDLKNLGFNVGYEEDGGFTSKDKAEDVKDSLIETISSEPQAPISIQELLKRL